MKEWRKLELTFTQYIVCRCQNKLTYFQQRSISSIFVLRSSLRLGCGLNMLEALGSIPSIYKTAKDAYKTHFIQTLEGKCFSFKGKDIYYQKETILLYL